MSGCGPLNNGMDVHQTLKSLPWNQTLGKGPARKRKGRKPAAQNERKRAGANRKTSTSASFTDKERASRRTSEWHEKRPRNTLPLQTPERRKRRKSGTERSDSSCSESHPRSPGSEIDTLFQPIIAAKKSISAGKSTTKRNRPAKSKRLKLGPPRRELKDQPLLDKEQSRSTESTPDNKTRLSQASTITYHGSGQRPVEPTPDNKTRLSQASTITYHGSGQRPVETTPDNKTRLSQASTITYHGSGQRQTDSDLIVSDDEIRLFSRTVNTPQATHASSSPNTSSHSPNALSDEEEEEDSGTLDGSENNDSCEADEDAYSDQDLPAFATPFKPKNAQGKTISESDKTKLIVSLRDIIETDEIINDPSFGKREWEIIEKVAIHKNPDLKVLFLQNNRSKQKVYEWIRSQLSALKKREKRAQKRREADPSEKRARVMFTEEEDNIIRECMEPLNRDAFITKKGKIRWLRIKERVEQSVGVRHHSSTDVFSQRYWHTMWWDDNKDQSLLKAYEEAKNAICFWDQVEENFFRYTDLGQLKPSNTVLRVRYGILTSNKNQKAEKHHKTSTISDKFILKSRYTEEEKQELINLHFFSFAIAKMKARETNQGGQLLAIERKFIFEYSRAQTEFEKASKLLPEGSSPEAIIDQIPHNSRKDIMDEVNTILKQNKTNLKTFFQAMKIFYFPENEEDLHTNG